MKEITLKISGKTDLLLHNGQVASPLNSFAKQLKEISGKRSKTEADFEQLAKLEWFAGLYRDANEDLVIPDYVLEATMVAGAKKTKNGQLAKSGMFVDGHASLDFEGRPDKIDEDALHRIYEGGQHTLQVLVKVQQNKVLRTRPKFKNWSLTTTVMYDPDITNESTVLQAFKDAGRFVGIGDWRPKYGRFEVEVV
ncbi:MAG: hypothetical protein EBV86_14270 [Marivivens sp.]|jgi:hypothetical protein|nr:hypothetical protein [Marivivens sp.]NCW69692.1 hypothetical protein [Marivivens sp.]